MHLTRMTVSVSAMERREQWSLHVSSVEAREIWRIYGVCTCPQWRRVRYGAHIIMVRI